LVDRNLILSKLAQLQEYLGQVREFEMIGLREYAGDWKVQRIVERTLQMMIELCVDASNHIIADKKLRVPESYADTFKVLQEAGLIDESLHLVMDKMAKFRNVIVHHYDKVDESIVVTVLRKHLNDFVVFIDAVVTIVGKSGT